MGEWTSERIARFREDLKDIGRNNHFLPDGTFKDFHGAHGSQTAVEVLVEKDDRVFLVHRVDEDWNGWHIPGGYIQSKAESIADACNRVAEREFGSAVRFKHMLHVYKWKPGEHPYGFPTSIVCLCEPLGKIQETETARFFDNAPDGFLAPCHKQFVELYFNWRLCQEFVWSLAFLTPYDFKHNREIAAGEGEVLVGRFFDSPDRSPYPHLMAESTYGRLISIPLQDPRMNDERREIHELNNPWGNWSIQAFRIKADNLPLGNHFHERKTEVFIILSGKVEKLIFARGKDLSGRKELTDLGPGTLIVIPPGWAHTFYMTPGSEMLCFSDAAFDPNNMDMFSAKLG